MLCDPSPSYYRDVGVVLKQEKHCEHGYKILYLRGRYSILYIKKLIEYMPFSLPILVWFF